MFLIVENNIYLEAVDLDYKFQKLWIDISVATIRYFGD